MDMLGKMVIGGRGKEDFGEWSLHWKVVSFDGVAWALFRPSDSGTAAPALKGFLKYVGWNRFSVKPMADILDDDKRGGDSDLQVYVHEWPYVRRALDWLYYELGARIAAEGPYEESFVETKEKDQANDPEYPSNLGSLAAMDVVTARVVSRWRSLT